MLKQWICATTGKVLFTPKGRAFNRAAPTLGATANTAFLSLLYGQSHSRFISQEKSNRYTCFARSQVRAHPDLDGWVLELSTKGITIRMMTVMCHCVAPMLV